MKCSVGNSSFTVRLTIRSVVAAVALAMSVALTVVGAERIEHKLSHQGLERWFIESKFPSYKAGNPVVIALHGGRGKMTDMLDFPSTLEANANAKGFMILAPSAIDIFTNQTKGGTTSLWNVHWDLIKPKPSDFFKQIDDVGFLKALANWAVTQRGADPKRVYLLGGSNGGAMVHRALIDTFPPIYAAATALVASMTVLTPELKKPNVTTPLFMMMGTADPAVPYLGGPLAAHTGEFNVGIGMSAQQTKDWWITANRADNRTSVVRVDKFPNRVWLDGCTVDAETYPAKAGDAGAAPVVFYTMRGGGHTYATTAIPAWCWLWGLGPCQGYEATWGPICVEVEALDLAYTFMSQYTLKAFP